MRHMRHMRTHANDPGIGSSCQGYGVVSLLGNILWLLCGGIFVAGAYALVGLVLCITIIGIPIGAQCFKLAAYSFTPFGRPTPGFEQDLGTFTLLANLLWLLTVGLPIASVHISMAAGCAITIIGIPFAVQHAKMALFALWPFGRPV